VKATYLLVLAFCLIGTLPLELVLHVGVYRRWRRLLCVLGCVLVPFVAWDIWAISRHQWAYDPRQTIGWLLPGRLPVEELLFFLVIPICAILTYEAVRVRRPSWSFGDTPDEPS
jgi:lycopene cyclase domain-containing protein